MCQGRNSSLHTYVKNIGSWRLFKPKPKSHMQQEIQKLCCIYWADVVRASCVKLSACMLCQPLVHLGCTCKTSWHEIQIGSSTRIVPWVHYVKSPAVTYWYWSTKGMRAWMLWLWGFSTWQDEDFIGRVPLMHSWPCMCEAALWWIDAEPTNIISFLEGMPCEPQVSCIWHSHSNNNTLFGALPTHVEEERVAAIKNDDWVGTCMKIRIWV